MEAARLRLRPILMTSFAFILGVLPLVIATGASSGARRALGTAVFGGMITATLLTIFIVPVLYVVIQEFVERRRPAVADRNLRRSPPNEEAIHHDRIAGCCTDGLHGWTELQAPPSAGSGDVPRRLRRRP